MPLAPQMRTPLKTLVILASYLGHASAVRVRYDCSRMLSDSLLKRVAAACVALIYAVFLAPAGSVRAQSSADASTATPIKHLVILFGENVSFDHYFATYPKASNPPGEPAFTPVAGTPAVNNLATAHLLTNNPNYTNS